MEEKTKQRLIGVLVLIGVLFVILPFLFHNSQPSVADKIRAEEAATTTNTASQPTVTLPPENATLPAATVSTNTTNAPVTNTNTPVVPVTPTPTPITPAEPAAVAPTTPTITPAPAPVSPTPTPTPTKTSSLSNNSFQPDHSVSPVSGLTTGEASTAQATAEATPSVTAPAETTTETAAVHHTHHAHAAAAHHHAIKKHHPVAAGHWTVQLAVFSEKRNAEKLISTLRAHHFPVHARHIRHNHFPMIAVFVGPEISETRAIAMQQRLHREFHLTGVVRKIEV